MAEPYAKIVVKRTEEDSFPWWDVVLESDLRAVPVDLFDSSVYVDCVAEANAWSQRLGGIPVEIEEDTK